MRFVPIAALFLLVACGSQSRYEYHYDDPWADYDPSQDRRTYDETYVSPSRMNADQLVERARRAVSQGRDDQARVYYHMAFRRDRWHPRANTDYQNLMLRNGLFQDLWQEYLDLWQQHLERGDAWWFHLRPMLLHREDEAIPEMRYRDLSDEQQERLNELQAESQAAEDRERALAAIDAALEIADRVELHRKRIELLHPVDYQALLDEYAARAEENPASGDALYLHAHVLSMRDAHGALKLLRDGWVLRLPGWWLRFGIAEICAQLAEDALDSGATGREAEGWLACAEAFSRRCENSRPEDPDAARLLAEVEFLQSRVE